MRFLFDTDHISIRQRQSPSEYSTVAARAASYQTGDFAYSIVSFEEQSRGANAYVGAAREPLEVVKRYRLLEALLVDYTGMTVLPFDVAAGSVFSRLAEARTRVGTMDLRIASIALSRGLIVLTRNIRDFGRVPGLVTEDWTVPAR